MEQTMNNLVNALRTEGAALAIDGGYGTSITAQRRIEATGKRNNRQLVDMGPTGRLLVHYKMPFNAGAEEAANQLEKACESLGWAVKPFGFGFIVTPREDAR